MPDLEATRLQRSVWNGMFEGRSIPEERKIRAARLRNPNSLRVRLHYARREIELSGDCYGVGWEDSDVGRCDLFKVPHHGDAKSVTEKLVAKLNPTYAVICCGRQYVPSKDRPSARVAAMLHAAGAQVWYTDAYSDGVRPAVDRFSVDFIIREDGEIVPPM